jgi:hypothetical protein
MDRRSGGLVAVILTSLIFLLATSLGLAGEKGAAEGKIAVVNGKAIPKSDFDREMLTANERFSQTGKTPSSAELSDVKKKILEYLIDVELLFRKVKKKELRLMKKLLRNNMKIGKSKSPVRKH